jgi:hypothetical protein
MINWNECEGITTDWETSVRTGGVPSEIWTDELATQNVLSYAPAWNCVGPNGQVLTFTKWAQEYRRNWFRLYTDNTRIFLVAWRVWPWNLIFCVVCWRCLEIRYEFYSCRPESPIHGDFVWDATGSERRCPCGRTRADREVVLSWYNSQLWANKIHFGK